MYASHSDFDAGSKTKIISDFYFEKPDFIFKFEPNFFVKFELGFYYDSWFLGMQLCLNVIVEAFKKEAPRMFWDNTFWVKFWLEIFIYGLVVILSILRWWSLGFLVSYFCKPVLHQICFLLYIVHKLTWISLLMLNYLDYHLYSLFLVRFSTIIFLNSWTA